jgi:hypothetical protein
MSSTPEVCTIDLNLRAVDEWVVLAKDAAGQIKAIGLRATLEIVLFHELKHALLAMETAGEPVAAAPLLHTCIQIKANVEEARFGLRAFESGEVEEMWDKDEDERVIILGLGLSGLEDRSTGSRTRRATFGSDGAFAAHMYRASGGTRQQFFNLETKAPLSLTGVSQVNLVRFSHWDADKFNSLGKGDFEAWVKTGNCDAWLGKLKLTRDMLPKLA